MARFAHRPRKKDASSEPPVSTPRLAIGIPASSKAAMKMKAVGARLWMRMDRYGQSELIECEKRVIINLASIPARDLRVLGPIFSQSTNIHAREKAILVNLEFLRAIITTEEVLLLDPLQQEVLPFVHKLGRQLPHRRLLEPVTQDGNFSTPARRKQVADLDDLDDQLPFEFQVLEIALEVVCSYLDSNVSELERDAYPALDELGRNVSTKNLEYVRSLKSNLTILLSRVQKVRDEIEHLLDNDEHMNELYVTRKQMLMQQADSSKRSNEARRLGRKSYKVEELEALLEAYFMQLDSTRNKILSVREYINDTEDYVNIQLDNKRNLLIQLQLALVIGTFAVAVNTLLVGFFGVNIPFILNNVNGIFGQANAIMTSISVVCGALVFGYARWKNLIGSS